MPLYGEMIIPKTSDEYEFEDMVCDVCKEIYKRPFQKYGRRGQKQYGIDIISMDSRELIAIQCKNYSITKGDIDSILKEIKECPQDIAKLIIATSSNRDVKIQNYIIEIQQQWEKQVEISIMFWEDIANIMSQNNGLLRKYYLNTKVDKTEELIEVFNQLIYEFQIVKFVNVDPVIGMPEVYPIMVDDFVCAIGIKLQENNDLQQHLVFQKINSFRDTINAYNGYLSTKLFPATTMYTIQNLYDREDVSKDNSEIRNTILIYKQKLDELYGEINEGCSLFAVQEIF